MDGKDRSTINMPKHMTDHGKDSDTETSAWNIVSLEELRPVTDLCGCSISKPISHETISEMENTLKDLVRKEEYVRNLRQEVEHKIRLFILSEASSGLAQITKTNHS